MRNGLLFTFLLLALAGCMSEPKFSRTPEISNIQPNLLPFNKNGPADTIQLEFGYKDGDGDLGMDDGDRTGTFARYINDDSSVINLFNNNLFVRFYAQNESGKWDSLGSVFNTVDPNNPIMTARPYETTFPRLIVEEGEPIEGEVNYFITGSFYLARFGGVIIPGYPQLVKGSKWYVKVQIADRKKNLSNVLYSSIQTVP